MRLRPWLFVLTLFPFGSPPAAAAATPEGYYLLRVAGSYDKGDFGTPDEIRTVFIPITIKRVWSRFGDVGITASYVRAETSGRFVLIEGVPARTQNGAVGTVTDQGLGDTVLRGRFFLLDDPGPLSRAPAATPFVKVKAPTADPARNLGTGEWDYGFGIELDKSYKPYFLFGDLGYTIIGDPAGRDLRDRPNVSVGAGVRFAKGASISAELDWRRSLVAGLDDPTEALISLRLPLTKTLGASTFAFKGLTSGSPDYGAGAGIDHKFGFR